MKRYNSVNRPAINIGLINVIKSIKCDHPCSEGYEVTNLISKNLSERNKGFLVEGFIKPPVTITLEFTQKVDLKYVLLQCNVGAQKSSGVELSVKQIFDENQYESVCSGVLKHNEKGFVFHRYGENVRGKFGEGFYFGCFKSSRNLSNVKSAKIKIFKTQGSSVPALGKVEVWGVPHNVGHQIVHHTISDPNQSLRQSSEPDKCTAVKHLPSEFNMNRNSIHLNGKVGSDWPVRLKIPGDFMDPITCELMCQPIILPSGNVVDISTLECFEKAESQWGRIPSDPFTGIPFTSTSKPIAASDLKARIDKFLCDNSNHPDLKTIPRTVGRSFALSQQTSPKPVVSKLILGKRQTASSSPDNNSSSISESEISEKQRKVYGSNKDCTVKKEKAALPNNYRTFSVARPDKLTSTSFQERIEKSLESSLRSTLSRLPSFTADGKKSEEKTKIECNSCKLNDQLFSIPCRHFVCRNCLVSLKTKGLFCTQCKSSFECHDVQKVHFSK